jgi:hypothetical protein
MTKNNEIVIKGFDLFYYETDEATSTVIAEAITGKASEFGDGWCITRMFDEDLHITSDEIIDVLHEATMLGRKLAEMFGGVCDGSELYVHGMQLTDEAMTGVFSK